MIKYSKTNLIVMTDSEKKKKKQNKTDKIFWQKCNYYEIFWNK